MRLCLVILLSVGWGVWALGDQGGGPKVVYIIRHAEKPDSKDDPNLSPRGYKRADALVKVFPARFCVPDFIWATAPSNHSLRPLETVTPLAQSLHLTALDEFSDDDYAKLAHELLSDGRFAGKSVLVCWHHEKIPDLASALGAKDAPDHWKDDVFDRVWELRFENGKVVDFENRPEEALPGDSQK